MSEESSSIGSLGERPGTVRYVHRRIDTGGSFRPPQAYGEDRPRGWHSSSRFHAAQIIELVRSRFQKSSICMTSPGILTMFQTVNSHNIHAEASKKSKAPTKQTSGTISSPSESNLYNIIN